MLTLRLSHPALGEKLTTLDQEDLSGEGVTIGRANRNQIVLEDPAVSRLHARLTLRQGSVFITDCGSTAGTSVNGARLSVNKPARLAEADRITIGQFTLDLAPAEADVESLGVTVMAAPPLASYMPLAGFEPQDLARWTGGEQVVRVMRVIDETADVKTFVFASEPPLLFTYLPGQFITLHLVIEGAKVSRSYSLSSTPSRPHTISITVKRAAAGEGQPAGVVSAWLHAHVVIGDTVTISGPYGDFSCVRHPSPRLLLISAGSGVTPMLSMARWLTDTAAEVDIAFLHSARTSADIICRQNLEMLAVENPRLRLVLATTRPEPGSRWVGLVGRLSIEMLKVAVPDFHRRTVFCCGPESFMKDVKHLLTAELFPVDNYHEESFGAPRRSPPTPTARTPTEYGLKALLKAEAPTPAAGQHSSATRTALKAEVASVTFLKSKVTVICAPGQTVLEAGESKGLKLPFGCRMGKCGACKQVKRCGEVVREGYDDAVLPPGDRSKGYILTCIAKPVGRVEIDA